MKELDSPVLFCVGPEARGSGIFGAPMRLLSERYSTRARYLVVGAEEGGRSRLSETKNQAIYLWSRPGLDWKVSLREAKPSLGCL